MRYYIAKTFFIIGIISLSIACLLMLYWLLIDDDSILAEYWFRFFIVGCVLEFFYKLIDPPEEYEEN